MRPGPSGSRLGLLLLALLLSAGCASRMAQVRQDTPTVSNVRVLAYKGVDDEGNPKRGRLAFARGALLEGLAQRQTSFLHYTPLTLWNPRYYLEGNAWREDATRIENFYSLRGYFDATVISSQILAGTATRPKNVQLATLPSGDPSFVRVEHTVVEGEPSSLRTLEIRLVDPNLSAEKREEMVAGLSRRIAATKGARFQMEVVDADVQVILDWLADRSYAVAEARAVVDAYPDELAVDVVYLVTPGPSSVFGKVEVRGLADVKERYVRRQVLTLEGKPWDGSKVRRTKAGIYGMGVFTMVTLSPDYASDQYDAEGRLIVPLFIELKERKPASFQYAPGLEWDIAGFELQPLDVELSHINLGGRLIQGTLKLTGGYRYLSVSDNFPTAGISGELRWPDIPWRRASLRLKGETEMGVERGYKFWTPSGAIGIGWTPLKILSLDVSYNLQYYDLFEARIGAEPVLPSECPEIGKAPGDCTPPSETETPKFPDNYILSYFRESLTLDLRDNPLAPNKGGFFQLASEQAFPFGRDSEGALRGFRYVKVEADLRGYAPLIANRLVLAGRIGGAHFFTSGEDHLLPVNKAVYLGGDGSVRGFKTRYLGPRGIEANCTRNDCIVPLGARTGISGSVELRARPFRDGPLSGLWLAVFTDAGRSWGDATSTSDIADADLRAYQDALYPQDFPLQMSVGGGVRYDVSFGRIRLDFAHRLRRWPTELAEFKEPFPWNIHFNLSESF